MQYENTALASFARVIGETLHDLYGIDPAPVYKEVGIDMEAFLRPGARVSIAALDKLWDRAVDLTGDKLIGLEIGRRAKPGDFYVLGHAWLASSTLLDALQRLCRYANIMSTETRRLEVELRADVYALIEIYSDPSLRSNPVSDDAGCAALLNMCEVIYGRPIRPVKVSLAADSTRRVKEYEDLFQCPLEYGCETEIWQFHAAELEEPLTGSIPEVAGATDRIAKDYLESLDHGAVTSRVRDLLLSVLPSGSADQDVISAAMHRSTSTLQRQLSAEGTSYRDILSSTRRTLAEQYLKSGEFSQSEIAFMIGFSDQGNFSRAFKRWTGMSPRQYQSSEKQNTSNHSMQGR